MKPRHFLTVLWETEQMAIRAIPYIPKRSKYRTYVYELLAKEDRIEAWKFGKLRRRLLKFHSQ